jgi:hypothetical protein
MNKTKEETVSWVKKFVGVADLVAEGIPECTAREVIKQAKLIACARFNPQNIGNLVLTSPFATCRALIAPLDIVEEILGVKLIHNDK